MLRAKKSLLIVGLAWIVFQALLLTRFPTVFIDEAENANHAYNAAFHGAAVFSLYDNLYPARLYFLRQSWPVVIRPFFVWPLAAWLKLVGFGLARARLFSFLAALGVLAIIGIAARGRGRSSRVWALAIAGTYFPFLYAAHSIRPEMMLTLMGAGQLALLLRGVEDGSWGWCVAAGLLGGVAPGAHTNGVVFGVAALFVLINGRNGRAFLWTALGWIVGTLAFLAAADWTRFLPGYHALFFQAFTTPPLFLWRQGLWHWVALELPRYTGPWIFPHWPSGLLFARILTLQHLLFLGLLAWGCFSAHPDIRRPALFGAGIVVGLMIGVGQKAVNYLSILTPAIALTTAAWLDSFPLRAALRDRSVGVVTGWTLWLVTALATLAFEAGAATYAPSYNTLIARWRTQLPAGARIAGPQEFWIGCAQDDYRDIGALMWHRLLNGEKNLWAPLAAWHPDYLLIDQGMANRLAALARQPGQPAMRPPTQFLPWPHDVLDVVETGPAYGTRIALIRVDTR